MNKEPIEHQVNAELADYFECHRNQRCPSSMKKNLYTEIGLKTNPFRWSPPLIATAFSLLFIVAVVFNASNDQPKLPTVDQISLSKAQEDMQLAMHYMNRVSLKSLTAVNNKGIKPALIMPFARTAASL